METEILGLTFWLRFGSGFKTKPKFGFRTSLIHIYHAHCTLIVLPVLTDTDLAAGFTRGIQIYRINTINFNMFGKQLTQKFYRADPFQTVQETTAFVCAVRQRYSHSSRGRRLHSTGPAAVPLEHGNTTSQPARHNNNSYHYQQRIRTTTNSAFVKKLIVFVSISDWIITAVQFYGDKTCNLVCY